MRNPGAHLGWSLAVCVSSPSPTKLGDQNFWTSVEYSKSKCLGSSSWVFPGPPLLPHNGQGSIWPLHQTQVTQQPRKFQQDIVSWKFSSVISPLLMNYCFQWYYPTASKLTRTASVWGRNKMRRRRNVRQRRRATLTSNKCNWDPTRGRFQREWEKNRIKSTDKPQHKFCCTTLPHEN